ncbi:peroxisomal dehydratase [Mycena leptocephala]|nr:peroxisomal dehydratase [Mycena leptocephala]
MAADLAKVVGYELPTRPVSWNKRDLLIYAAGVGGKAEDLNIVYELDKSFAALPTYPVVLGLKGDSQELNLFAGRVGQPVPGLPRFDPNKMVHGTQSIEVLKDLPFVSGPGWTLTSRYTGVVENKSGIILSSENILLDPKGVPYAKLYGSAFYIGAKATGDKFSKVIAGPPQGKPIPKDRKADWVVQTRPAGDYNPLHIDPAIGKAAGFGGVILHGLSTFGFAARALIKAIGGGDPRSLTFFGVRFTSPGTIEVAFVTKNLTSGKAALGGGIAYIKKAPQAKL